MDESKPSTDPIEQPEEVPRGFPPSAARAGSAVADPKPPTGQGGRWRLMSTLVRETSLKLGSEVRAAGEGAVVRARKRTYAWSLQRERANRLGAIGQRVLEARGEIENLPASVVWECERVVAIDEELRRIGNDAARARPEAPGA